MWWACLWGMEVLIVYHWGSQKVPDRVKFSEFPDRLPSGKCSGSMLWVEWSQDYSSDHLPGKSWIQPWYSKKFSDKFKVSKNKAHLLWQGVRHIEVLWYSRFLWSGIIWKGCLAPSNQWNHSFKVSSTARSSLFSTSYFLFFYVRHWVLFCFSPIHRERMAPTPKSEASTTMTNSCYGSGCCKIETMVKVFLSFSKTSNSCEWISCKRSQSLRISAIP